MKKPILWLDFDGVLHEMERFEDLHIIKGPAVPGAMHFLRDATRVFNVVVFGGRSCSWRGRRAMRRWVLQQLVTMFGLEEARRIVSQLLFPGRKPPARVHLDDRGQTFTGTFPPLEVLYNFKPWNHERSESE